MTASLIYCHRYHLLLQADINDKMRAILVDWLVEVHLKFKVILLPDERLHQRVLLCHAAAADIDCMQTMSSSCSAT